jgi:uncharacterized membrane protein YdbT with pleckstrin-like domain
MGKEDTILSTTNSRKLYIPIYFMGVFLLLLILFLELKGFSINKSVFLVTVIFIFLLILGTEIHRLKSKYEISANSVVHIEGYINKTAKRIDLFAISDVDVSQKWWQRILNFGNVSVHLFSAESTTPIKNINNPKNFALILEQQMRKKRVGGRKNV